MSWNPKKLTKSQLEERRFAACDFFESGITNCFHISEQLGCSLSITYDWYKIFKEHGREGLKQKQHKGPGKSISEEQIIKIKETILKGAEVYGFIGNYWTSKRIVILIRDLTDISYHFNHVSKLLHEWNFSYQKPEKKHVKRNDKQIADWLTETLPEFKKN